MSTTACTLVDIKGAAARLGVSVSTAKRLDLPRLKIRHRTLYRIADIDQWIGDRVQHPASEATPTA